MSNPRQKVDIEPVIDLSPDHLETALTTLCGSLAVQRARISTRGTFRVIDEATGEAIEGEGPALVLVVNERLMRQGW